jgi:hypothetical protein
MKLDPNVLTVDLALLAPYDPPPPAAPRFLTPVYVRLERDETYTVLAAVEYESALTGKSYVIPAGFNTDFASVPRLPLAFLLAGGVGDRAALVHDYLYRTGAEPRNVADDVFAEALRAIAVPGWRSSLMWAGVRVGGLSSYVGGASWVPPHEPAVIDD